jgi:hypothetical protein
MLHDHTIRLFPQRTATLSWVIGGIAVHARVVAHIGRDELLVSRVVTDLVAERIKILPRAIRARRLHSTRRFCGEKLP